MNVSEHWLRSYLSSAPSTKQIVDTLTMGGLEVDAVMPAAPDFTGVVVGEIVEVSAHPDAAKLRVCSVKGHPDQELTQVVCGAPNARAGIKIPFALVGACLPESIDKNGQASKLFKIKKAKLRGVESFGMLCGADELGLVDDGPSSDGIWELPLALTTGENLRDALYLDDQVIEVDLTPNRSDCLSVEGIARDLRVLLQEQSSPDDGASVGSVLSEIPAVPAQHGAAFEITLSAPDSCPLYAGRLIKNINSDAESPLWMKERLRRAGIRSINASVDITNYVMIELGQPMHAFDACLLGSSENEIASADSLLKSGGIEVRAAKNRERIELLNDQTIELASDNLVIANSDGQALALAGIMGGKSCGVSDSTRHIFLESAHFIPANLAGKARSFGLHTDSSHRFERGVDPKLVKLAIERATALILDICGGQPGPVVLELAENIDERQVILREAGIEPKLGFRMERPEVERIVQGLGFTIESTASEADGLSWTLRVPSWRFDVTIEADLIEELARVYGYNNLPSRLPSSVQHLGSAPEASLPSKSLKQFFAANGFHEAVTYSFIDRETNSLFNESEEAIELINPISQELAVMRGSLLPGLLGAVKYNRRRQQSSIRLFEEGLVFSKTQSSAKEQGYKVGDFQQIPSFALVMAGETDVSWQSKTRKFEFYDAKALIEQWCQSLGVTSVWRANADTRYLHPGQSAVLGVEHEGAWRKLGVLGKLHPRIAKALNLDVDCFVFEGSLPGLLAKPVANFLPISDQPRSTRDLSLVAPESVSYAEIERTVLANTGELACEVTCFDIYQGEGIPTDMRSLALALSLQSNDRALREEEITTAVDNILGALKAIEVRIR